MAYLVSGALRGRRPAWVALIAVLLCAAVLAPDASASTVPPDASFTITPAAPYQVGESLTFSANTTTDPNGGFLTYLWTVDGTPGSTGSSFSQSFAVGSHTISLDVTDSEGDPTQTTSQTITVFNLPTASFTYTTPDVSGGAITFDASASQDNNGGSITTYSWDFGDGSTGSGVSPSHSYASGTTYTVTLTVTDSEGDVSSTSNPVTVQQAQPPTATFTAPSGAEGAPLSFDASGSSDPNPGGTLSYAWDFGDGTTSTSMTTSHSYALSGSYSARLTVTDNYGQSSSSTQTVVVSDATATASITTSASSTTVGNPITFTGTRSGDPDDSVLSYAWRFGDGASSTGLSAGAQHAYEVPGTYTVVLTITDQDGQSSASQRVTVAPAPYAPAAPSAAFPAPGGREGASVPFDGSGSRDPNPGATLSYRWDFGDGVQAAGAHASHTFAAGTWTVTLTVTDNTSGQSAAVAHRVTIADEAPTATFAAPSARVGSPARFNARASDRDGTIRSYRWKFGDGARASGPNATHTYAKPGRYRVALTVLDSSGQTTTVVRTVVVTRTRAHAKRTKVTRLNVLGSRMRG